MCQWLVECGVNVWKWHNGPIRGRKWSNFKRIHQIIYQRGSKWKINVSNFRIVKYLFWLFTRFHFPPLFFLELLNHLLKSLISCLSHSQYVNDSWLRRMVVMFFVTDCNDLKIVKITIRKFQFPLILKFIGESSWKVLIYQNYSYTCLTSLSYKKMENQFKLHHWQVIQSAFSWCWWWWCGEVGGMSTTNRTSFSFFSRQSFSLTRPCQFIQIII